MARRGVQDRLDILRFEGGRGMNVYYYAPKTTLPPKLWRSPTRKQLRQLRSRHTAETISLTSASLSARPLDGLFERQDFACWRQNSRVCEDSAFLLCAFPR